MSSRALQAFEILSLMKLNYISKYQNRNVQLLKKSSQISQKNPEISSLLVPSIYFILFYLRQGLLGAGIKSVCHHFLAVPNILDKGSQLYHYLPNKALVREPGDVRPVGGVSVW